MQPVESNDQKDNRVLSRSRVKQIMRRASLVLPVLGGHAHTNEARDHPFGSQRAPGTSTLQSSEAIDGHSTPQLKANTNVEDYIEPISEPQVECYMSYTEASAENTADKYTDVTGDNTQS